MLSLSIIIPCYNVEAYLPKTIFSLSQLNNADNCEFIFINDGSTDCTGSIIENFVEMGYYVPAFLTKGLQVAAELIEAKTPLADHKE